jgi:GNAT superfamily N-acetyltransferase
MPVTVRPGVPADTAVIAEFNRLLAYESENKQLDPDLVRRGVAAVLADPVKGRYFVAEEDGRICGQASITYEWSDWRNGWIWWLQSVYVRQEARRQGVFAALHNHIRQTAQAAGDVLGLRLYVERNNLTAQATYRKLGMEPMPFLLFGQGT